MISYAFVDADGYVTGAGSGPRLREGAVELPDGITPMTSIATMQVDGVFVPRPMVPEPVVTAFEAAGRAVQFADLPPGTTAEIIDVDAGYTIATLPEVKGLIAIELPDPGRYRIEVNPPRPFLQMIIDIEVPA